MSSYLPADIKQTIKNPSLLKLAIWIFLKALFIISAYLHLKILNLKCPLTKLYKDL